jgi:hypothetical protein
MAEAPLPATDSAVYQSWVMLLNGWGFNWYKLENQLRADDLLIRSRASEELGAGVARLRALETEFRQHFLPPPSRQQPLPDPQRLEQLHRIQALIDRLAALDTALRGAAVPPEDKIWARHRNEARLLTDLAHSDTLLVGAAMGLSENLRRLTLDDFCAATSPMVVEQGLDALRAVLDRRSALLAIQPGSIA